MPELPQGSFQKRQIAHKLRISDILGECDVSRVNIIATLVYKSESPNYSSAIVDDGTGKILVSSFENSDKFAKTDVGDAVLVIGKIRKFNSERYIMPEIFKKINNIGWVDVRKFELENTSFSSNSKIVDSASIAEVPANANEEVYLLIKNLDKGDGAPIDDVVNNSNSAEAEAIINKLLEKGDVFEVNPGRLKILE